MDEIMMASADAKDSESVEKDDVTKEDESIDNGIEDKSEMEGLSKKAQKRLLKRKMWLEQRPERRAKEREKRKRKMEAMKEIKQFDETRCASRKALKHCKMTDSPCKVGVVFDMDFDELMSQKDLGKCLKQVLHCYSINRRLPAPLQLYITSFEGEVVKEMEKNQGYQNWDLHFHSEKYGEVLEKDKIVYLSSESENVLESLENDKFYVIGGLVDHNLHKGVCHHRATEAGVKTARLPIDEYVEMKTRKVLTIDHVFQILARVTEGKSWKEAFVSIIPERKGVVVKKEEKVGNGKIKDEVEDEQDNADLVGNVPIEDCGKGVVVNKQEENVGNGTIKDEVEDKQDYACLVENVPTEDCGTGDEK